MKICEISKLSKLNTTPLAIVRIENSSVIVEADDEQEERVRFVLRPYQALRITTADCFSLPEGVALKPGVVMEVFDSSWIDELNRSLSLVDVTANFMTKARHFIFPLQDDFLEVVAWDISEEALSRKIGVSEPLI